MQCSALCVGPSRLRPATDHAARDHSSADPVCCSLEPLGPSPRCSSKHLKKTRGEIARQLPTRGGGGESAVEVSVQAMQAAAGEEGTAWAGQRGTAGQERVFCLLSNVYYRQ